jgi:hypothetical protein
MPELQKWNKFIVQPAQFQGKKVTKITKMTKRNFFAKKA